MVVGLLGNENPDLNRFTLVTPKPANGVRLQATLDNQNPTGLPVGAVRLEDAECEYERSLHRSNTPIYSFRTLMNPEKFQRLKLLNAAYHGFGILSKDVERFEKAVC